MNIYSVSRYFGSLKSFRVKLLGLYGLHLFGKRYLGVYLDPVLSCNLRCQMCYFSDEERRKELHGKLEIGEIEQIAKGLFHRALKLQIGCGAEPTLHKELLRIVELGHLHKVPYISLTTNGNLLTESTLMELVEVGLNELTVSLHGIYEQTYETLMEQASFSKFKALLQAIIAVKKRYPCFRVRINYTVNADNMKELTDFWSLFSSVPIDILQLRPIQKIGNSRYTNFDLTEIKNHYEDVLLPLVTDCQKRGVICIHPDKSHLMNLEQSNFSKDKIVQDFVYCYISPHTCWESDYDFHHDTYESYAHRVHLGKNILYALFWGKSKQESSGEKTRKMNYKIN